MSSQFEQIIISQLNNNLGSLSRRLPRAPSGKPWAPTLTVQTGLRTTEITVQGQIPLAGLLPGAPVAWLSSVIPRRSLDDPVCITLAETVGLEEASSAGRPRYAEAMLIDCRVGYLSIPGWLLTTMAGPRGASLLRWQVRALVERLEGGGGDGKLTIRTR
jgi:hypothetical protein